MDKFTQSYSQAPWRKQLQFIGLFSLILVFVALVAPLALVGLWLTRSAVDSSDRFRTVTSWYMATQRMLLSEAREQGLELGSR